MLTLHTKIEAAGLAAGHLVEHLVLAYDQREKCRLRARLASGEEVGIFTARGTVLRDGDLLVGADSSQESGEERGEDSGAEAGTGSGTVQRVVRVAAALEATYRVDCANAHVLARCAFHLGNRHTQTQVGAGFLRIRADPVLKAMVEGLGAQVALEDAAFEPEAGAYSGAGHNHGEPGHLLAPIPVRQKIHRPGDAPGA